MSITDDQITLSGQLRYQYFDKPGFATISDNNHFAEYDERIGKLIETSFLYAYLALGGDASASTQLECGKLITSFPDRNGGYSISLYADGRIEQCYYLVRFPYCIETNYHFTNDNLLQKDWYFYKGTLHEIIPEHGKDAYIKLVMDEWKKPKY